MSLDYIHYLKRHHCGQGANLFPINFCLKNIFPDRTQKLSNLNSICVFGCSIDPWLCSVNLKRYLPQRMTCFEIMHNFPFRRYEFQMILSCVSLAKFNSRCIYMSDLAMQFCIAFLQNKSSDWPLIRIIL